MSYHARHRRRRSHLGMGDGAPTYEQCAASKCTLPGCTIYSGCQGAGQFHPTPTTSPSGGSSSPEKAGPSAGDVIGGFFKALTGSFGTSTMTPAQPVIIQAPPSGPSTTTMVAIGGAALLAVILLTD